MRVYLKLSLYFFTAIAIPRFVQLYLYVFLCMTCLHERPSVIINLETLESVSWTSKFTLLFMFGKFFGVKFCKFNVFDNPSIPQRYDRLYYSLGCNTEFKNIT